MSTGVTLSCSEFGMLTDGTGRSASVQKFTWETAAGLKLSVLNLDAAIIELYVPDRTSQVSANVLLGVNSLDEYIQLDPELRCAACFERPLQKATKEHLPEEPGRRDWLPFVDGTQLQLSLELSGSVRNSLIIATVTITVETSNVVRFQYRTTCTTGGLIRLSHRCLLNLAGNDAGPCATFEHVVQVNADSYVDGMRSLRCATDNLADLRIAQHLGLILYNARNEGNHSASALCGTYSMNNASEEGFALRLIHAGSGRALEIYCDYPWMHFSTLNQLPEGPDAIVPFYPQQGLRRLSLVFDIDRFLVSIVDAIERTSSENAAHDEQRPKDNQRSEKDQDGQTRFVRNAGFLLHPLACPFKIRSGHKDAGKASRSQMNGNRPSGFLTFTGQMRLKFGICKPIASQARESILREINRTEDNNMHRTEMQ